MSSKQGDKQPKQKLTDQSRHIATATHSERLTVLLRLSNISPKSIVDSRSHDAEVWENPEPNITRHGTESRTQTSRSPNYEADFGQPNVESLGHEADSKQLGLDHRLQTPGCRVFAPCSI